MHGLFETFVQSCAASAPICPSACSPMRNSRRWSTPRTNGSGSAPASASAISRPRARRHRCSARARQKSRLPAPGSTAADIDLIVVGTSTPDYTFPAVATQIQAALGITRGVAFDLQAVCSGFVFAVTTADKFLASGSHKRALVIGAETFSRLLDWSDRTTCVLFGDGAGAMVLEAVESDGSLASPRRHRNAAALRRTPPRKALCRRRPFDDQDGWPSAHGRQGGVQARRRHGHRRDPRLFR